MTNAEWKIGEIRLWVLNEESNYRRMQELANTYARQKIAKTFNRKRAIEEIADYVIDPVISYLLAKYPENFGTRVSDRIRIAASKRIFDYMAEDIDYKIKELTN